MCQVFNCLIFKQLLLVAYVIDPMIVKKSDISILLLNSLNALTGLTFGITLAATLIASPVLECDY
jgi:hypothetical protein